MLKNRVKAYYPDCRETARWSAQDCMTLDGEAGLSFRPHFPSYIMISFTLFTVCLRRVVDQMPFLVKTGTVFQREKADGMWLPVSESGG